MAEQPAMCMFRGISQSDVDVYKRTGKFPPSDVPVFHDWEVMEYEGITDPEEMGNEYNRKDWLNVTHDKGNAEGYGDILIWVNYALCDRTPSNQYGVVARKLITPKTKGKYWDFISPVNIQAP
jgi:hypothetical protein